MGKSILRQEEDFELFLLYTTCFISDFLIRYINTLNFKSYNTILFIRHLFNHRVLINSSLTFVAAILHYQILQGKKIEIYCRLLVGATLKDITFVYFENCIIILLLSYLVSVILHVFMDIRLDNNRYLIFLLLFNIVIGIKQVICYESN